MRKSAAPSQAFNRPRFIAPLLSNRQPSNTIQGAAPNDKSNTSAETTGSAPRNDVLKVLQKISSSHCSSTPDSVKELPSSEPVAKKPRFQPPSVSAAPRQKFQSPCTVRTEQENVNSNIGTSSDGNPSKYLNVVWCKRSNKKHKKWEGDAVLVTHGRSVTLYDTEGKEIGKGSGYKSGELATLKEDETLFVGGKEIQVMGVITEEQFKSGKCFTGASLPASNPQPKKAPEPSNKPFSKPQLLGQTVPQVITAAPQQITPRHDPSMPGALVLPQPSQEHQWKWNKKSAKVIDVVVDPYLSIHLRPHQREGVNFLYECVMGFRNYGGFGAILADDMGLGKTLQCISLIWTLHKQGPYGGKPIARKILIVTPGSLVKNWLQEIKKWLGFERLQVYAVSSDKKIDDFLKTSVYPVLIISYEMFVRVYEQIQQITFDLVVCDEGHRLKNTQIKTSSLLMSLPTQRRIVLTGTPIQNDLQEFYSIVEFCNPGVFGSSAAFRRIYEDPIVRSRQPGATPTEISLGEERGAELARMTQMFVLRRTQEINNKYLPPKGEIVVFCYPSELQLKLYHQLLRCQLIRSCLSGSLSGSPHLICIGALKQLCNHPALIYQKAKKSEAAIVENDETETVYKDLLSKYPEDFRANDDLVVHSGKLAVLSSLLHQLKSRQEKIVVVSNHTKTLDLIQLFCDQQSFKYLRLDGQTPVAKRQELVQRFNDKHICDFIFLLSSKAGGVGLNLIGASRLVLYDIDWNPANDLQAMARVWRDGQKKKVHIYRLLTTGTIEEKIYQRQICKQGLSGSVIDVREKNDVQFSLADLRDLFSINTSTTCDTHDLLNCDCDIEDREPEPAQTTVIRSCQLGIAAKQNKKRNLGMDELMEWKHSPGTAIVNKNEWFLQDAADRISYFFHSEIQNTTTS